MGLIRPFLPAHIMIDLKYIYSCNLQQQYIKILSTTPERIPHAKRKHLCSTIASLRETKNRVLKVFVAHVQLDLVAAKKFYLFSL